MLDRPALAPNDTRAQIIETSLTLFAARGYAGVSVRDIVDAVGLTPGAIYHHFTNKRALYDIVVQRAFDFVSDNLVEEARREGSPEDQLRGALRSFALYLFARSPEMVMVDRIIFEAGERGLDFATMINGPRGALAGIIRSIAPAAPAEDLAEHMIAAIYGAAKLRPVRAGFGDGDRFDDPRHLADSLGDLLLLSLDSGRRDRTVHGQ